MRHSGFPRWAAMLLPAGTMLAQSAPPFFSVSGTVTNSVTGEPILRAHVTVHCTARQEQAYGALTNAKGEFTVGRLPPGSCRASAERVGFVALTNTNSSFTSGAATEGIKLTLTPTGAITGRVLDSAGEPAQGVYVTAEESSATTDDKGQFRLGGLSPGKYRVRATRQAMPFPQEISSDGSTEVHESPTWYPDSLSAKTAQRVEVSAGAEVGGVDIRLVRTPLVMVSGKVTGLPPGAKNVMVNTLRGQSASVKPDGTFTIWRLDPGKYSLVAESYSGKTPLMSAPVEIEVAGANLEHLELRIIPPFDLAGQMRFEDEGARQPASPRATAGQPAPQIPPPAPRMVRLRTLDYPTGQEPLAPIGADDSFTLEKVQPGRYRVSISWGTAYVKSVRAGETESLRDILDVRNGPAGPLTVTVSANFCELSGMVSDSKGPVADAEVSLVPAEDPSNSRVARADSAGVYRFTRLPPGKYKLIPGEQRGLVNRQFPGQDPDDYDDGAESVDLAAGDKITKDLTLMR